MKNIKYILLSFLFIILTSFSEIKVMNKSELMKNTASTLLNLDDKQVLDQYDWVFIQKQGDITIGTSSENNLPERLISLINNSKNDDVFVIENVKVKNNSGEVVEIGGTSFKIAN